MSKSEIKDESLGEELIVVGDLLFSGAIVGDFLGESGKCLPPFVDWKEALETDEHYDQVVNEEEKDFHYDVRGGRVNECRWRCSVVLVNVERSMDNVRKESQWPDQPGADSCVRS